MANLAAASRGADKAAAPEYFDRSRPAPRWMTWVQRAAIACALGYTAPRIWWAMYGSPSFGPRHIDLIVFTGWSAVGLCAAAVGVAVALSRSGWSRALLAGAWAVSAAMLAAAAVLLLDVVGGLLPGLGVPFEPVGFASRAGCAVVGALLGASAVAYRRRWRSECLFCGRTGTRVRPTRTPWWAWAAAYVAVAGCLVRLGAQVAAGFETFMVNTSPSLLIFEAGFVLAGTVLPLALVHSWGRSVPRWVPVLAGRRIPRWLVLGPGFFIGGAMTAYFGFTLLMLVLATLSGTPERVTGSFSVAFFWVAVPAYFVWGVGLAAAAIAYYRTTRPLCRVCGQ